MKYFEEITKVPRPSGQLTAIQDYLINFAKKHNLESEKDSAGNVLIKHPGIFSKKHIILQSHQDMVPAVRDGSAFVFGKDSVTFYVKDGWMYADETSLGADDGTGIAVSLDALVSEELQDCSFDCIFTADEETTMNGVRNISPAWLFADALINIDSEEWGSVCVSCAGGAVVETVFHPVLENMPTASCYRLSVSGLRSGHSGIMIDSGRLNAVRTGAEFLSELHDVRLISCTGGSAKNVIPGTAEFMFTAADAQICSLAAAFAKSHAAETDPDLKMEIEPVSASTIPWTKESTAQILSALSSVPNGCFKRSASGPLLSSNLGVLRTEADGTVSVTCFVRGNDNVECEAKAAEIKKFFDDAGAETSVSDKFPGWKEPEDSSLLQMVKDVYRSMFNAEISVYTTHGGLEGGYFAEKNPVLQIVSIGPDIENPHTVFERLNVDSFLRLKEFVYALVKENCGK
ncbi:MAG TPA: beta-Ala-His dipeptidase [Methanocorpusculum sp.]|nr:beta-Ala-His dipeptidase [Methanocorpusculum sp.]